MKLPSLSTTLLLTSLALWPNKMAWAEGDTNKLTPSECTSLTTSVRGKTVTALNTDIWAGISEQNRQKIESVFLRTMRHEFNGEEVGKFITKLLQQEDIQDANRTTQENSKQYDTMDIILTLLAWLGWGLGIAKQLGKSKKEDETDMLFEKISTSLPVPVVRYNKDGFPLIWNKHMEEETGYSHTEVIAYFKKNGEVMTLLYKWENLERVQQYLAQIAAGWEGYENIAFTMTAKSWEEKTFLWTTFPDGHNGTIRIARHLTDLKEIHAELAKMREFVKRDGLTGAYTKLALLHDMQELLCNRREEDPVDMSIFFLDIDDFKYINDCHGHEMGDGILKGLVEFLHENMREGDKIYRFWGDEFIILLKNHNLDKIIAKLNSLRHEFHSKTGVWTSLWVVSFNTADYAKYDTGEKAEEMSKEQIEAITKALKDQADRYMYAVKYYRLIRDTLIQEGKIQANQPEKNGVAVPQYDQAGEFLWVQVFSDHPTFFITGEQLNTIERLKRENKTLTQRDGG